MTAKETAKLVTLACRCEQLLRDPARQSCDLWRGEMRAIIAAAKSLGVMPLWRSDAGAK